MRSTNIQPGFPPLHPNPMLGQSSPAQRGCLEGVGTEMRDGALHDVTGTVWLPRSLCLCGAVPTFEPGRGPSRFPGIFSNGGSHEQRRLSGLTTTTPQGDYSPGTYRNPNEGGRHATRIPSRVNGFRRQRLLTQHDQTPDGRALLSSGPSRWKAGTYSNTGGEPFPMLPPAGMGGHAVSRGPEEGRAAPPPTERGVRPRAIRSCGTNGVKSGWPVSLPQGMAA